MEGNHYGWEYCGSWCADKLCTALKSIERNMQHSLIQEIMFYEFELDHNPAEATKNICYAKGEGIIDHSTAIRKKFCLGCKNLNEARSGRNKSIDFEAMLQAIEANLVTLKEYQVSLASNSPVWFVIFTKLANVFRAFELPLTLLKYRKSFAIYIQPFYHGSKVTQDQMLNGKILVWIQSSN